MQTYPYDNPYFDYVTNTLNIQTELHNIFQQQNIFNPIQPFPGLLTEGAK